jgi:hypothetical protein
MPATETGVISGSGGSTLFVDSANRARIKPIDDFLAAVARGDAYSWASQTYDPDAHDTILGVENNEPDRMLYIERIIVTSDTASQIQVFASSGATMAGTAVTGANLNHTSGRLALASAYADETGNGAQGAGYPGLLFTDYVAANTLKTIEIGGAVAIGYDHMIGVDLTTAATAANVTIFGWFE